MSKTTIVYDDIAPGAAEDATTESSSGTDFSQISLVPLGVSPESVISNEVNSWLLNGTFTFSNTQTLAFWSEELSDKDSNFINPPVITITTTQQYSSVGLTFDFGGDSWATDINIKWFKEDTLLSEADFVPDSLKYFCAKQVENYNKIVITLKSMSLPYRRAKINHIVFGLRREFDMTELRSVSITNEIGLISEEVPTSKLNWTLDSDADVGFMFQLKQPVYARNNDTLIGAYYIDNFTRSAATVYTIECIDAFGVLNESMFAGGIYNNKSAKTILREIIGTDFEIVYDNVEDIELSGIIESGTKRDAIQQVLFAWGVCASTDGRQNIRIFSLDITPKEFTEDDIFSGVTMDVSSLVTQVSVTAHTYTEDESGNVEVNGKKYKDVTEVYTVMNPNITASDKQNAVEVTDATLVSPSIGQAVAQRVYDFYMKRYTTKASIVWKGECLGDCVTVLNTWNEPKTGNINHMEIKLSNTVVASIEVTGD